MEVDEKYEINKLNLFLFIICVKSIINILQYNSIIADCASGVPKLTLLDLQTNWTYKHTLRMDLRHTLLSYCRQPEDLPNISETQSTYWTCALNNS